MKALAGMAKVHSASPKHPLSLPHLSPYLQLIKPLLIALILSAPLFVTVRSLYSPLGIV